MLKLILRATALAPVLFVLQGSASAMSLDSISSPDTLVTSVTCVFNGPNCVTGKYPDMQQELRNEAGYGIENPGCRGDCNQFGFIPDTKRNMGSPVATGGHQRRL